MRGSLLALGLAVLVGGAGLLPATLGEDEPRAADPSPPATSPAPTPDSGPAAGPVAAWLDAALPEATDVTASAAVRGELADAGVPADRLLPAEGGVPVGALLAVVGTAPEGSRVVAAFDRTGDGSRLLVVDPAPGEPTAGELARRQSLARALLANPTTRADGAAGAVLRDAAVDERLLSLLAAVTASDGVGIAAFPPLPGEEGTALLARRVLVDAVGDAPVPGDPAATDRLLTWLAAQLPPFAPDDVEVTGAGVLVSFRYVSAPGATVSAATG
ncbi:hypothetical protein [Geodermatophilus amargosae]|uniref:hypothetical protein n=1 Tax=Geodermatophilus amargosae TaxID=1296565 RepID=UPI0034DF9D6F